MEREKVIEASSLLKRLDNAFDLKATVQAGQHELRLYALAKDETMEDEVSIKNQTLAVELVDLAITRIMDRLVELGVTDLQTA